MTDYRAKTEKSKSSDRKEKFFTRRNIPSANENRQGLTSKEQESDGLIKKTRDITNKYRPDIIVKDPSTFAFFGSAKKYYEDAFSNIVNYYPFDGSRKEILEWYETATSVEIGMLHNHWPSYVGHVSIDSQQYISFYSGPQSIAESEYMGAYTRGETGLRLDPSKGNTVEFWLKKGSWSIPEEVVFDIGSYPGKVSAANGGQFKLYLSNSSGSPFHVDYSIGTTGISATNIGSSNITTSSVGDSAWHHYALKVHQEDSKLHMKLYVDGKYDSLTTSSVATMGSVDTYMSGRIGAAQADTTGSLSGSMDDFRFWKGKRTSKQISRFFDQKVFASENLEETYETKLGLYYRFNKPAIADTETDRLVVDYSGNDITGQIYKYDNTVRVAESAITISPYTSASELQDPHLEDKSSAVQDLKVDLVNIGESYDINNASNLKNFVPEWVFDNNNDGLSNPDSHVSILFHLLASEFDEIRQKIDGIKLEKLPRYESITQEITSHEDFSQLGMSSSYMQNNFFIGCDDSGEIYAPSLGSHAEFSVRKCENVGFNVVQKPLSSVDPNDEQDLKVAQVSITKPFEEIRRAILENVYSSAKYMLKRKGTATAFGAVLRSYGVDEDLVSLNIYGRNSETFIDNSKLDTAIDERNSVYFGENLNSTIFLSSSDNEERTYLQADTDETEYTFEGTFMFPSFRDKQHDTNTSSIFGVSEVSAINNNLTAPATNNADFVVKVAKDNLSSDDAKFILTSPAGIISDLESNVFRDVYDNSRWNIALKVVKDLDNKFVSSSAATYKVELVGHNHILDTLQNSFSITSSLTQAEYENFRSAHKTIFIGAQRTNITGSVVTSTDIKVVDFNGWNDDLSLDELKVRSMTPSTTGRDNSDTYRENYNTVNKLKDKNKIFSIQFDAISALSSENTLVAVDATSGSVDHVARYGQLIGNKYPAKSTVFSKNLTNVIQREYLPVVRNIPLGNDHGEQGIQTKAAEINKFDLSSRPQSKLLSFEKSMYQAISREMVDFVGGLLSFNNLIGEPVNKYRKSYKMLDHLRQKFFETVESENQFERFVSYFRWIDKSVGHFLDQMVPATATTNTGIEDVIESHALERNKYDHKAPFVERKEYDSGLETNLLAINELLYDWEHGHNSDSEADHCLWQKDRKERTGDRETIRKVLTTVVSGSTYVTRNLVKPYRHTIDRQTLLNIGSNRNANKNKDLYKIVNEGKEISISSSDIYEFKQCNDVINPQQEKIYSAKTNTTTTDSYLDADSDMILPFSLYSSSVGVDFENFKQNLKITNNHDGTPSLQSPFVKSLVGGMPHRSVKFGTADADRPEAYDVSSSANTLTIKQTSAPKSMFHRDLGGARFYHIGNVKTTETPLVIGNYSKDYEIVMTNGRSLNNNYLVENEGLNLTGGISQGLYVPAITEFEVPQRPARDHVIVNRFNAPGGAESSTPQGMNRESLEYSVYSTVNYRNGVVRYIEDFLSEEHSEQFGYRSGSTTQASRHMTNRNTGKKTGSLGQELEYDNNYVQHEIPQNDFGYSWVTSSANESVYSFLNKNENTGHQHLLNISGALKSSQTITFLGTSELTPNLDFVNLNTFTTRSLTSDVNMLTNNSADLNSIVLNRQGPYGWPSWKQLKGEQHPITKAHKKNNKLSVVYRTHNSKKYAFVDSIKGDYEFDFKDTIDISDTNTSARLVDNYDEMYITSKFNPLNVNLTRFDNTSISLENLDLAIRSAIGVPILAVNQLSQHHMWTNDEYYLGTVLRDASRHSDGLSFDEEDEFMMFSPEGALSEDEQAMLSTALGGLRESAAVSMRATVQNKITGFAQRKFENLVIAGVQNPEIWSKYIDHDKYVSETSFAVLKNFLTEGITSRTMRELNYIETIYPREINTYKSKIRARDSFDFFGWNSTRSNRQLILTGNVSYDTPLIENSDVRLFFPQSALAEEREFKKSFYNTVEMVDINSTGSDASTTSSTHITASSWVLDSRETFTGLPLNITSSYFTEGDNFLRSRSQGTRGEGILQNDYSIFGLGYNGLRGAPPISPVYNRRIPQIHGNNSYLAGEAKYEAAATRTGPFYDSYQDYAEGLRSAGQTYSLIPEFRMHKVIEDYLTTVDSSKFAIDEFLELTGTVYHTSSGNLSVGTQFFETYSMTDFMKYFQVVKDDIENENLGLAPGKLTLRCQAVKRFLPYRGFYPAERVVQISEVFDRSYLRPGSYGSKYIENDSIKEDAAKSYLDLRIENSKAQAIKPLMAPGVLMNSIKTGLAVDYPIFSSSVDTGVSYIFNNHITSALDDFSLLSLGTSTAFTGSLINSSVDEGIPRVSGTLDYRVSFEDLLYPHRIWDQIVYDNEPHPSASMLHGTTDHLKVLDRPPRFGNIDRDMSTQYGAMNFETSENAFAISMLPFTLATNNFCAETVNFFLEDGVLNTAISAPGAQYFDNLTYKMRVHLANEDTVMYDRHSAFGPPVDEGNPEITTYNLSSTKIYNDDGTAASASVSFAASTARPLTEIPTEVTASSLTVLNAVFDSFPGFSFESANSQTVNVKYYDSENFVGDNIKFKFGEAYTSATQTFLSTALQHPRITISGAAGQHKFRFYNSNTSGGTQSDLSDTAYVNVYDTSAGALRDGSEVAQEFFTKFVSIPVMSQSFAAFLGTGADAGKLNLFGRTRSIDSDISITSDISIAGFSHYDDTSTKFIARITTGSNSNGHTSGDYGTEQINFSSSATSTSWAARLAALDSSISRYVNIGAAEPLSAATVATATRDAVLALSSSTAAYQISASIGASSNIVTLRRLDSGSQGNVPIGNPGEAVSATDLVSSISTSFAGGALQTIAGKADVFTPTTAIQSGSHGHLPYVPPFLDPNTSPYAELSFTPASAGEYTIPEVLNDLQITYYNMPAPSNQSENINYNAAMVLSASIDFKNHIKLRSDHTNTNVGSNTVDPNSVDLNRWVIRPKWETPIIDFSFVTASAINLNDNSEQQVSGSPWKTRYQSNYYETLKTSSVPYLTASTGMWHQSGNLLDELAQKGYYMVVEAGDQKNPDRFAAKDLATKVGFLDGSESSKRIRLGNLATEKTVWESVVAIPFYNDPKQGIKFFNLNAEAYRDATKLNHINMIRHSARVSDNSLDQNTKKQLNQLYDNFLNTPGTNAAENIAYQLRMMEKFIIPPQFDFLSNNVDCADVAPFVQYIFQFSGKFTDKDLASMWQNLYPNSEQGSGKAKHSSPYPNSGQPSGISLDYPDVEYVSGFLDTDSVGIFQGMSSNYEDTSEFLENEVRWLVFKAKQRGTSRYDTIVEKSVSKNNHYDLISVNGREISAESMKSAQLKPQFNWPYDYFSLVELGKIESKVDFYDDIRTVGVPKESPRRLEKERGNQQASPPKTPAVGSTSSSTSSSSSTTTVATSMVFREVLLEDTTTPSTRIFNITGGTVSSGTEQLFVNGVLQSLGGTNDYTISGNTVTFTYDLDDGDSVVISYVKD
jgi:hypothetical protein